jgi:hypothetical protein
LHSQNTVYRFNIIESVLHNVTIESSSLTPANKWLVANVMIKGGIVQLDYDALTSNFIIDYAMLELAPETAAQVPNGNPKLAITRS